MNSVTFGIPGLVAEELQIALGLTDEEMFALEQKHLRQREEVTRMRDQLANWQTYQCQAAEEYHRLWVAVYKLARVVCDHYQMSRKYELQDRALESDDELLRAAWKVAELLDQRTLPR